MSAPTHFQTHADGLYVIDTGFERDLFDAAYLLVSPEGRAAFIDTGHNAAVPRLLATLAALGLRVEAVDWVIPTHVHLDHAGGAGLLMEQLPNARALIHPRGARHLVNPLALVEGARAVYGAEVVKATYGDIRPIPAERVVESHDDMTVQLGSRALRLIDTPGHARHHHCIWDEASRGWFTGDTFGISYREFDSADGAWIFPSTTPVQFEPEALRSSVQRTPNLSSTSTRSAWMTSDWSASSTQSRSVSMSSSPSSICSLVCAPRSTTKPRLHPLKQRA